MNKQLSMPDRAEVLLVVPTNDGPKNSCVIESHCKNLSLILSNDESSRITILFSNEMARPDRNDWYDVYSEHPHISVLFLDELGEQPCPIYGSAAIIHRSYRILSFLRRSHFDVVYFYDIDANGFAPIQLKKCGLALQGSRLITIVTNQEPEKPDGSRLYRSHIERSVQQWAERYVRENADVTVFNSQELEQSPQLSTNLGSDNSKTLQSPFKETPQTELRQTGDSEPRIVYFGEPGDLDLIKVFSAAIEALLRVNKVSISEILFLCRFDTGTDLEGLDLIWTVSEGYPDLSTKLRLESDGHSLQSLLEDDSTLVIVAGNLKQSHYKLLDCIEMGIPFLFFSHEKLSSYLTPACQIGIDTGQLISAILSHTQGTLPRKHSYSAQSSNSQWIQFNQHQVSMPHRSKGLSLNGCTVGVCMTHFNHGEYLPDSLASIARSEHNIDEVIIIDDGSTDPASVRVFEEMKMLYPDWTFIRSSNQGPGAARNTAVKEIINPAIKNI